jgi:hypothetical protein
MSDFPNKFPNDPPSTFCLIKAVYKWIRWFVITKWENLTSMRNGPRTYSKMSITIPMPIQHTTDPCVDTKIIQVLEKRYISLFQDLDRFVSTYVSIACRIDMGPYQRNLHIKNMWKIQSWYILTWSNVINNDNCIHEERKGWVLF